MAVKIRLKRMGKIRAPFYRVVVVDARKKRDGRVIEEIGTYNPKTEPSAIHLQSERAKYWLSVGAQPTEAAAALLKATGDDGGAGELKTPEAANNKEEIFQAALKEFHADVESAATSSKKTMKKAKTDDAAGPKDKAEKADSSQASDSSKAASAAEAADGVDKAGVDKAGADKAGADKAGADKAAADQPAGATEA